ncbi:MAG TPA: hypothetical protein VJK02_05115 [Anaerolineales bacterium]|nr:hypothetical protein [Anaerolineales bacterium]
MMVEPGTSLTEKQWEEYYEAVTSTPTPTGSGQGAVAKRYQGKRATSISAQRGTQNIGGHVFVYDPELMVLLAEAL